MDLFKEPLLFLIRRTSRKGIDWSRSLSKVKSMEGWHELKVCRISSKSILLSQTTNVSSMYFTYRWNRLIIERSWSFSTFVMKQFAKVGPSGDPIAISSLCLYISSLKLNWTLKLQHNNSSFKCSVGKPRSMLLESIYSHI
ncbi:unnamed protein product [Schistosoma haematobium]|nr:unnamed protein product [Schistosoma haematobium]CAH8552571.1 unnamed protein product [Schistosoma haematobium]